METSAMPFQIILPILTMVLLILAIFPAGLGKAWLSWPSSATGIAWDGDCPTSCEGPGSSLRDVGGSDGGPDVEASVVLPRSAAHGLNVTLRRAPSPFEEELVKREIEGNHPLRGEDLGIRDDVVSPVMALSVVGGRPKKIHEGFQSKNCSRQKGVKRQSYD